jgi:uncharacterized protein YfcZ (UPF0381/DUF406 family)
MLERTPRIGDVLRRPESSKDTALYEVVAYHNDGDELIFYAKEIEGKQWFPVTNDWTREPDVPRIHERLGDLAVELCKSEECLSDVASALGTVALREGLVRKAKEVIGKRDEYKEQVREVEKSARQQEADLCEIKIALGLHPHAAMNIVRLKLSVIKMGQTFVTLVPPRLALDVLRPNGVLRKQLAHILQCAESDKQLVDEVKALKASNDTYRKQWQRLSESFGVPKLKKKKLIREASEALSVLLNLTGTTNVKAAVEAVGGWAVYLEKIAKVGHLDEKSLDIVTMSVCDRLHQYASLLIEKERLESKLHDAEIRYETVKGLLQEFTCNGAA